MYEPKHRKVPNELKHSSHAFIDRSLLKSMQIDITHASELIIALREEKEKLKECLRQAQKENHEKNSLIRSLKNKLKHIENTQEDDEVIRELSEANLKLKTEIEYSLHGISLKNSETTNEIISLTEIFVIQANTEKSSLFFKNHMRSPNHFKQIIGNEN